MANGCESLKLNGWAQECHGNVGGIKAVYIADAQDVTVAKSAIDAAQSATAQAEKHVINASDIKMADGKTFLEYVFAKDTSSLETTMTNDANGKRFETILNLQFNRMEGWKHLEIEALAVNEIVILVQDKNNVMHLVGVDNGATLNDASMTTGVNFEDLNGYTTSLRQVSAYTPFMVKYDGDEATAFNALIGKNL